MSATRVNRTVKTGNRKDQQRRLKASWRILIDTPKGTRRESYLAAEDQLRAWNKARLADPTFGVEPTVKINPAEEGKARGHRGARLADFYYGYFHDRTGKHGLGRRRKTRKEE